MHLIWDNSLLSSIKAAGESIFFFNPINLGDLFKTKEKRWREQMRETEYEQIIFDIKDQMSNKMYQKNLLI